MKVGIGLGLILTGVVLAILYVMGRVVFAIADGVFDVVVVLAVVLGTFGALLKLYDDGR